MEKLKKIICKKKNLLCILLFFLSFCVTSQEVLKQYQTFKWKPIARAKKYQVVVEQKDTKGLYQQSESIETTDCRVEMLLLPGDYRVSINAYNVLNKKASSSPWVSFVILDEKEPYLLDNIFEYNSEYDAFVLRRSQTEKMVDTSAELTQAAEEKIVEIPTEDVTEQTLDSQEEEDKIETQDVDSELPVLSNLELRNRLTISGRNIFFTETKFSFVPIENEKFKSLNTERPVVDLPIVIRDREQNQLEVELDWTRLFAGYYRFEVSNPGGFVDSIELLVLPERNSSFVDTSFNYNKRYEVNTLLIKRSKNLQSIKLKGIDFQSDTVFSLEPSKGIPYPFSSEKKEIKLY